jgi:hypothetical protein
MARNDIQRILANRPGRAEHGNILNFWHLLKSRKTGWPRMNTVFDRCNPWLNFIN